MHSFNIGQSDCDKTKKTFKYVFVVKQILNTTKLRNFKFSKNIDAISHDRFKMTDW